MTDKKFCMSSYLVFRYIEKQNVNFYDNLKHKNIIPVAESKKTLVRTASDIDDAIQKIFDGLKGQKLGIFLSGGMDSAILASYMSGADAYTFRFEDRKFQNEELNRAKYFAEYYNLKLHYVEISWDKTVKPYINAVMETKGAPVHSIEPQLVQGAEQAKADGVERLIIGESSDLIFGGMDGLLSKDWTIEEFIKRYTFCPADRVLKEPIDMSYLFKKFLKKDKDGNHIFDFLDFMNNVFSIESSSSYLNAFKTANIPYTDPYAKLKMAEPLDLHRIRNGESKYLIRELMHNKYPEISVPDKNPMPRPVDFYFKNWKGPVRPEFKENLDMSTFTGNQKWQIWCLEHFLNLHEPVVGNVYARY